MAKMRAMKVGCADGTVEMMEEDAESFLCAGWIRVDDQ
jgi:hypothetical protein